MRLGVLRIFMLFCVLVFVRAILSWWPSTWHINIVYIILYLNIYSIYNSNTECYLSTLNNYNYSNMKRKHIIVFRGIHKVNELLLVAIVCRVLLLQYGVAFAFGSTLPFLLEKYGQTRARTTPHSILMGISLPDLVHT